MRGQAYWAVFGLLVLIVLAATLIYLSSVEHELFRLQLEGARLDGRLDAFKVALP